MGLVALDVAPQLLNRVVVGCVARQLMHRQDDGYSVSSQIDGGIAYAPTKGINVPTE